MENPFDIAKRGAYTEATNRLDRDDKGVSVLDVAAYILDAWGPMTTWKLQKLVYYSQAWSLVWDDDALFPEEIKAWANGPVVPELYAKHKRAYRVSMIRGGNPHTLTDDQRETVDAILGHYGDKSPQWLSDLTHMEDPWKNTRQGMADSQRGDKVIPKQDLAEYYGSL